MHRLNVILYGSRHLARNDSSIQMSTYIKIPLYLYIYIFSHMLNFFIVSFLREVAYFIQFNQSFRIGRRSRLQVEVKRFYCIDSSRSTEAYLSVDIRCICTYTLILLHLSMRQFLLHVIIMFTWPVYLRIYPIHLYL